jgi:hypothetical protein
MRFEKIEREEKIKLPFLKWMFYSDYINYMEPVVAQPFLKLPAFYKTRRSSVVIKRGGNWSLSQDMDQWQVKSSPHLPILYL